MVHRTRSACWRTGALVPPWFVGKSAGGLGDEESGVRVVEKG